MSIVFIHITLLSQCILSKIQNISVNNLCSGFWRNFYRCSVFVYLFFLETSFVRIRIQYESLLGISACPYFTPTPSSQPIFVHFLKKVGMIFLPSISRLSVLFPVVVLGYIGRSSQLHATWPNLLCSPRLSVLPCQVEFFGNSSLMFAAFDLCLCHLM